MLRLVAARARRRRSAASLVALSVAGSIVVLGSLLGIGIVTEDLATRRALAELPPSERLIGIRKPSEDGFGDADADAVARRALEPVFAVTEPIVAMTMYQPPADPFRVLAMDDPGRWIQVTAGRMPAPCGAGARCETIRIGPDALQSGVGEIGTAVDLGEMHLEIVGIAAASLDLPLSFIQPDGLVLMVDGHAGIRDAIETHSVPRTSFWLAPIDAERIHSWTLADLEARVDAVERTLAPTGRSYLLSTPERTLAAVHARTAVAAGRLVFVSSLIVGVLLAFAAFAAAIERTDVVLEDRRLRAAGASRAARFAFVAGEALLPAIAGAVVGVLGAALAVGVLAANQGAPVDVILGLALLQPGSIALGLFLAALAAIAVGLGIHPAAGRLLEPRLVVAAALPALALLVWTRITAGPADPAALAAEAVSPSTVILPGLLGLAVILGSLVLLPPLLRGLARITRRAPLPIRLAAISAAREPLRPAAVMTLLAFSLGAVVFGLVYSSTLRQGAADQAAFQVGMDVRVQTLAAEGSFSSQVIPLLREGAVGSDVVVQPMVRLDGESASGRTFTLAGIQSDAIGELRGWRSDFSAVAPAALGESVALDGDWALAFQPLPDGAREVAITVVSSGDPVRLSVVLEEADSSVRYVPLGELAGGRQTLRAPVLDEDELAVLPATEPTGWRILGLIAANGGQAAVGEPFSGNRQEADVTIAGLESIIDPATPVHIDVSGARSAQFIRPPARTDGLILPAIVSPDLVGDVDPEGILDVRIGSSLDLRLRPVGVTTLFPTLDPGRVVIVDLAPLLLSMNAHDPGTGRPNQVLLRTPNDARTAEVVAALGGEPFPHLIVQSRPGIEAARASDPFAIGIVWALAVGAIAGLILSIAGVLLATSTELRDERGELWELEAQGGTPASLTRLVVLRTAALCLVGAVTGIVLGIGIGWFAATTIGVAGEGASPLPPLVLQAPWLLISAIAVALLLVLALAVLVLTRRHFRPPSLGEGVR